MCKLMTLWKQTFTVVVARAFPESLLEVAEREPSQQKCAWRGGRRGRRMGKEEGGVMSEE